MQLSFRIVILLLGLCAAQAQHSSRRLLYGSSGSSGSASRTTTSSGSSYGSSSGSSSSGSSGSSSMGTGSAAADPQVVDFSGRHFEFIGELGSIYSVIQDPAHQVSMRLKLGILYDHNGTYIDGIGFAYQGHKIVIELSNGDENDMSVSLDGQRLIMEGSETTQEHELILPLGKLRVTWELYRPNFGNTITIQTDLIRFTVYRTDKGSLDKGGLPQPSFLNFDAKLLYPPAHALQGIVGEGYTRILNGEGHTLPNDGTFYGNADDYLLPHYFPENLPASQKLLLPARRAHRRLIEEVSRAIFHINLAATAAALDIDMLPVAHAGVSRAYKV